MKRYIGSLLLAAVLAATGLVAQCGVAAAKLRQYYVAVDEIDWNYMPAGKDETMAMAPMRYGKFFATRGPHLIGSVYRKAIYREYTNATFKHLKPRRADDAYLGILGPVIHAEVGDVIHVVFRNNGTHPYSMHPHGVFYEKASEGSPYDDGIPDAKKGGDSVAPGKTFTYVWQVPERAGPGPADPSSIAWFYHSHAEDRKDVNAGLVGAIVVTRKGMARADGTPRDVDREFVALYLAFDESQSWFLDENVKRFTTDPGHVNLAELVQMDPEHHFDFFIGQGIGAQNFRFTVNGYQFSNGPMMVMKKGEHGRWYLLNLGEGLNFHTPHWHGNTVTVNGRRTDVIALSPADMLTADMVPDNPGIWLFHCHVADHMDAGMVAKYEVLP